MKTAPPAIDEEKWRLLFEMGDKLLSQSSIYKQIDILEQDFGDITSAKIEVRLSERFKPLPSQVVDARESPNRLTSFVDSSNLISDEMKIDREANGFDVPLKKESSLLGKIHLTYDQPVKITGDFQDFLIIAGRYIAAILDMTRLSALKDWRNEQLSLVRSASYEIARYRNANELFEKIVRLIQSTFQFYFVALYTFAGDAPKLILQANAGRNLSVEELNNLNMGDGIPLGKGLVGACAESGKEILSQDVHQDERYRFVDALAEIHSEICLPLTINEQSLGVLEITSDRPDAFHENDIMVLRILADSVALAVENAELFDDLLEKTWISTVMLQVAEAAQAYDNIQDLLEAIVRILPLLVGVEKCAIYRGEKNSSDLFLNAYHGFEKDMEPELAMLPYSDQAAKRFHEVMVLKIPLDFDRDLLAGLSKKNGKGSRCCKLVPIVAHDKVFGILLIDEDLHAPFESRQGRFNQQDVLMAVARQIALAIENFELKESREYETYITAVLLQVAEMVTASGDLDETLANIINLLPLVVGVDTALIYLLDDQGKRMHLRAKYSQSWKKQVDSLAQSVRVGINKSLDKIGHQQKPVICSINDQPPGQWLQIDYQPFLDGDKIPVIREPALMIFPLFINEEAFGYLMVHESGEGLEIREKKVEIITGIAQQLSIAIQNEHLKREMVDRERLRREFQLAQDIQKTFLPEKLPVIPGWEIAVRWRPALQVGGDFYDAIPISENHYGLVIADVSDKGLPASLYMTVARTLIHAAAGEGNSPVDTLQQVNHLLLENSREGLFITVFYAILDVESGELVYANAGHNKPLLLRNKRSETLWLDKGGMPLGVTKPLELDNKTLQIRPGDHLVMYTDGVTDARAPDDSLFGEDRLFHVVSSFKSKGQSLIETIDSKITDFQSNAPAADDVTLFVVRRLID